MQTVNERLTHEDVTELTNKRLREIVRELDNLLKNFPDHIRPYEADCVGATAIDYLNLAQQATGELPETSEKINAPEEYNATFIEGLSDPAIANLFLKMPLTERSDHIEARVNRKLALEAADILGPDHAQALYRFAVLVTKLA